MGVCCYFGVCPQLIVHGVCWKILMRTGCICEWYRGRKNWEPLSTEHPLCWESVALSPPVNVWQALWLGKCDFILPPIPLTRGRAKGAPLVHSADHRYIWYLLMISVLKSLYFRLWKMQTIAMQGVPSKENVNDLFFCVSQVWFLDQLRSLKSHL